MNPGIKELHAQLVATHAQLSRRLGQTMDQDEAEAILREMEELNFRVMMAGRLLFKTTTARIDRRLDALVAAGAELARTIEAVEEVNDLVKAVGQFLGPVDRVLDRVKLR